MITLTSKSIAEHEIAIRKLNDEKDKLTDKVNKINSEIIVHWNVIQNLKSEE